MYFRNLRQHELGVTLAGGYEYRDRTVGICPVINGSLTVRGGLVQAPGAEERQ